MHVHEASPLNVLLIKVLRIHLGFILSWLISTELGRSRAQMRRSVGTGFIP